MKKLREMDGCMISNFLFFLYENPVYLNRINAAANTSRVG